MSVAGQMDDAYRFDWGTSGLRAVGRGAAVIVIVDVLSYTTAVDLTVSHGGSTPGSTLCRDAGTFSGAVVLAGCLRNASAVGERALAWAGGRPIAVIAAGDQTADGSVRNAVEDFLGAGAIFAALDPSAAVSAPRCSPEAAAARAAFMSARYRMVEHVGRCAGGLDLIERGWAEDVDIAAAVDVSRTVPILRGDTFEP
jgi:2-phosphosulfolactate phosphatase